MTPEPLDVRGPIETTLRNQHVKPEDLFFFGDHLVSTGKTVGISVNTFFLEITSVFGPNYSIFSVNFGLHKTGNSSYLSWPRAHFWSPAALNRYRNMPYLPSSNCKYCTPNWNPFYEFFEFGLKFGLNSFRSWEGQQASNVYSIMYIPVFSHERLEYANQTSKILRQ